MWLTTVIAFASFVPGVPYQIRLCPVKVVEVVGKLLFRGEGRLHLARCDRRQAPINFDVFVMRPY
jgi:hypothetical protein